MEIEYDYPDMMRHLNLSVKVKNKKKAMTIKFDTENDAIRAMNIAKQLIKVLKEE